MPKQSKSIDDYIVVAIPENPYVFGIQRQALDNERFVKQDPNKDIGEVYDSVMHIVSPYVNYYTGEKTESCSCIGWRTRKQRCVHLKAFYKKNPHMDKSTKIKENSKELREIRKLVEEEINKENAPNHTTTTATPAPATNQPQQCKKTEIESTG